LLVLPESAGASRTAQHRRLASPRWLGMCAQRAGLGEGRQAAREGSEAPTGKAVYSFVSAPVEHVS
jgi:hypothetical protein